MPYVYSTATSSTTYNIYPEVVHKEVSRPVHSITIKGGANVKPFDRETPSGARTEVTDNELKMLMNDFHFKKHMEAGHIKVVDKKIVVEKAVRDMKPKDESAPKTPKDPEFVAQRKRNEERRNS